MIRRAPIGAAGHRPVPLLAQLGLAMFSALLLTAQAAPDMHKGRAERTAAVTEGARDGGGKGPWFVDIAQPSGLDFVHFNGMSGEYYMIENLGGGGAFLDYDNDGDLDIYLVQGAMLGPGKSLAQATFPPQPGKSVSDRLYRNDSLIHPNGAHTPRFTDVTEASGIDAPGYGMGVAVGDVDNDGWVDIYVNNYGPNQLFKNNGDGTFTDITAAAGVGEPRLSVSAAFLDSDRDGWLDLFVTNYLAFDPTKNRICHAPNGARDYCSPLIYEAEPDRLYHNRGDGTFEDVSDEAGITREYGAALGVVAADFNGDGWTDAYVANDGTANQLWVNQGDGSFRNEGLLSGTAVNMEGVAEASMGVDAADFDGDGDEDLFMTHLLGETNTIYVNDGKGWFEDRTTATGLGAPSKAYTSFGTAWCDFDNDGWLDLLMANGGVNVFLSLVLASDPYPLHQTNQLFLNRGDGRLAEVTAEAGEVFALSEVSRGLSCGDVDNDGDADVLLVNNNGRARLLLNNLGEGTHWIGLRLLDESGRDAFGAKVVVTRPGAVPIWRRVRTDGSYASAHDARVLVGLADTKHVDRVEVLWPSGRHEAWSGLAADQYLTLREGTGKEIQAR